MSAAATVARTAGDALRRARLIPRVWIGVACVCISVLLLPLFFPLDGKPHADWLQFLGRFHPLVVHLPIGLILVLPLVEFAGTRRQSFREAASLLLQISLGACVVSTLDFSWPMAAEKWAPPSRVTCAVESCWSLSCRCA